MAGDGVDPSPLISWTFVPVSASLPYSPSNDSEKEVQKQGFRAVNHLQAFTELVSTSMSITKNSDSLSLTHTHIS